jgi:ferrous iron transport protein B
MHYRLVDLQPEKAAVVQRVEGGKSLLSRLATMGFTPGALVTVIRTGDHGPLLVSLRGSRVALGQGEAEHIFVTAVEEKLQREPEPLPTSRLTIALAGQPNVGKSSVFNLLTGLNQHVGNWTGKTVECKTGTFSYKGTEFNIIDLPGTYSLTASSEEERIARDYIIQQKPDLIVAVVNAATLEHSLYLVAELLLLQAPIVLALNMTDVAKQEGLQIEPEVLAAAIGVPVVPMAASKGVGIGELQEAILQMSQHKLAYTPKRPSILPAHKPVLDQLQSLIGSYVPPEYPQDWVALKLLEGDEELSKLIDSRVPPEVSEKVHSLLYQHEDAILDIAGARYEWVARVIRAAVVEPKVSRIGLTTRLDRVLTHPVWGTFALVVILGLTFWLTYQVGSPMQQWLSRMVGLLADTIRANWTQAPKWLVEFSAGGVLGGIGMVLTFLPILIIFFLILGLMEDTGYMARAAYVTDRWMHLMGLHGKSFLPILLGFGCNVPAVMGTRIIESPRSRLLTTLLIPLVPCTARLAVITILASLFFGPNAFWVVWGLVGFCLLLLVGIGFLLHSVFFGNEHVPFIMELPLYHLPNARTIGIYVKDNVVGFLKKAGTTILFASLIVWALSYFPSGSVMTSYLGMVGKFLEPVGRSMGLPWPMLVALLTSFVAKENTIATLGILYGNLNSLTGTISPLAMLAFLVFQILFVPCIGTVAAIHQETHSWKWTLASVGMQLVLSLGLATLVYQVGSLI